MPFCKYDLPQKKLGQDLSDYDRKQLDLDDRLQKAIALRYKKLRYQEEHLYDETQPDPFLEDDPPVYVAINENIIRVLQDEGLSLQNHDWKEFFAVAAVDDVWSDGTFSLNFPLFYKYIENLWTCSDDKKTSGQIADESGFSFRMKLIDPTLWHIPRAGIEPLENMNDAFVLLNL